MKVIIAGCRYINDAEPLVEAIRDSKFNITEVVSGNAKGVDTLGEQWAVENKVPIILFPANWELYNKAAGFIRNKQMAEYADALIAIWDGVSKGTESMIKLAEKNGLKVYVLDVGDVYDDSQYGG